MIDSRAVIHETAEIAENVTIGPYAIIGENAKIGEGCNISAHAVIGKNAIVGKNNRIFQFASVGEEPIDHSFHGEFSQLILGDNNIIRECATIHAGTAKEDGTTRIGNNNLIMNYVHIGHDCQVGNKVTLVNNAALAGHVRVDDFATIGVNSGVHQFCRIGAYSFIAHMALITQDVPPYLMVASSPTSPCGINIEGLKRAKFSTQEIRAIREAYKIIYRQGLRLVDAIEKLKVMQKEISAIERFVTLLENSKRGIIR
ncbi:acyl-ACP--UDP-N-acetylglucosamine O-acyltransferase [Fastidiosibacter lacustris]|uniref:acyl-ACP--UDP-N-acetylglucosamine O-acyltransferase n=1 Tax=Fastidiosibacter lacustris TaxID=2056695 RepID=UPI000E34D8BF|nr:acyl-ACP--UDP-N-acetylglucosamine O-acyltransferase [Fastidiosibacter lacustris]